MCVYYRFPPLNEWLAMVFLVTTNKTQNSELEIVSLVESNFLFYRDGWLASKKV